MKDREILYQVKSVIKSNPTLFRLWYLLYRKWRGVPIQYLNQNTQLYIDGYPRSGNTFCSHLVKNLWPDLIYVHHFHAVAPIKIALKKRVPVFILLRDPLNAISSWYLKELTFWKKKFSAHEIDNVVLTNLANDYLNYYQWIRKNSQELNLVEFGKLTQKPEQVMLRISRVLPSKLKIDDLRLQEVVSQIKRESFGAKDKLGASLPTEEKEFAKDSVKQELRQLPSFKDCKIIYDAIKSNL